MPPRAEFQIGDRRFEALVLDEEVHTFVIGCRLIGHSGRTRGEDVASVICKRVGMTKNWTPRTVSVPARAQVQNGERVLVMMGMLQYAIQVLGLVFQQPNYLTEGDQIGWGRWHQHQKQPAFELEVVP